MGIHIKHQTHVSKALLIGKIRYFPFNIMTLMRKSHETDHSSRLYGRTRVCLHPTVGPTSFSTKKMTPQKNQRSEIIFGVCLVGGSQLL